MPRALPDPPDGPREASIKCCLLQFCLPYGAVTTSRNFQMHGHDWLHYQCPTRLPAATPRLLIRPFLEHDGGLAGFGADAACRWRCKSRHAMDKSRGRRKKARLPRRLACRPRVGCRLPRTTIYPTGRTLTDHTHTNSQIIYERYEIHFILEVTEYTKVPPTQMDRQRNVLWRGVKARLCYRVGRRPRAPARRGAAAARGRSGS